MPTPTPRPLAPTRPLDVHQLRREAWRLGADRPRAALVLLDLAHRQQPTDADVLWQKALFEHAAGDLGSAERSLKQLLGVRSGHTEAMGLLARVLQRLDRAEEARGWEHRRGRLVEA